MDLKTYLEQLTDEQCVAFAAKLHRHPGYLRRIANDTRGDHRPSVELALAMVAATNNQLTLQELRKDLFGPDAAPAPKTNSKKKTAGTRARARA